MAGPNAPLGGPLLRYLLRLRLLFNAKQREKMVAQGFPRMAPAERVVSLFENMFFDARQACRPRAVGAEPAFEFDETWIARAMDYHDFHAAGRKRLEPIFNQIGARE